MPRFPPTRSALRRTQTRRSSRSERRRVAGHDKAESTVSLDALPGDFERRVRRAQDQAVADEFVAADEIAALAGLQVVGAMMRDRAGAFVDRVSAEIGDVVLQRDEGLLGR